MSSLRGADESDDADKGESDEESYDDVRARSTCDAASGTWDKENKKCKCKNAKGRTINTKNPDECYISVGEKEEVEEDDDLDTGAIVCNDKGGTWKDGKCSCKNSRGKSITTSNPVSDCVKQDATKADKGNADSGKKDDEKKKGLSDMQKRACQNRGGTVNADSTLCSCKDRNGKSISTENPINKCVKQKDNTVKSDAKTNAGAE